MRSTSLGLALTLSLAPSSWSAPSEDGSDTTPLVDAKEITPPGLVPLEGGQTVVGADPKDLEELLQPVSRHGRDRTLDGETPQHNVQVRPFFMGKYEVTNEQYLVFVQATGSRPPEHWGEEAIAQARAEFGKQEQDKLQAAEAAGETYTRKRWSPEVSEKWWMQNWQEATWSIPEGQEKMPVVFVDYESARSYAEWAGMRLPTEAEWEHAARGGKEQMFPWGDEWEAAGRAHTRESRQAKLIPVGTYAEGTSEYGICDLAGSVWEWTSEPYNPHPRFKPNKYKVESTGGKKKTLTPTPRWDANMRVTKGGSFQNELIAARVSTRRASDRSQTAAAVGFRVASSQILGRDAAAALYEERISSSPVRSDGQKFDFDAVVGLDRWSTQDPEGKRPEGYSIVSGYERIILVPRHELELGSGGALNRASRETPELFAYFSTTIPFVEPKLAPGDYIVAYREKGTVLEPGETGEEETVQGEDGEAVVIDDDTPLELLTPAERLLRQIELQENLLIFIDARTGEYVDSVKTSKVVDVKDKKSLANGVQYEQRTVWVGETARDKVQEKHDYLTFDAKVRRTAKSRIFPLHLEMRVENDAIGTGWRR